MDTDWTPSGMHRAFAILGVAFLAIFSWVFFQEYFAEWRTTQAAFDRLQSERKDPHELSLAPPLGAIRQIWLPDIDRVDRCVTCHLGADDPAFPAVPQPFRTHTGEFLETHPPDRFGCTVCHDGQGEATTYRDAAHQPIPYWPAPVRSRELIEANCGACHREREPAGTLTLAAGRRRIAEAGCVGCHDLPGFAIDDIAAPRLDSTGYKVRADWLRRWLTDPATALPRARMPNFRLTPDEIEELSAFLLSQRSTAPLDSSGVDWTQGDAERGRVIYGESRCASCHMVDDRGGTLGPDLSRIGSKVSREWLYSYLENPMHDQPETRMLRYRFTDVQLRDLVVYLIEELFDPDAPATAPEIRYLDPDQVAAGRGAYIRHGCYACHRLASLDEQAKIGPSLMTIGDRPVEASEFMEAGVTPSLENWLFLKLRAPESLADESRMPTYGFTERESADVVVALLSIRKADLPASRVTQAPRPAPYQPQGGFGALVSRYRCLTCHQVRGWGGTLSTVPLDRIGSQLQHDYLAAYLQNPSAVRVSVEERMPHFNMTEEEARTLADLLSTVFVDDALERALAPDPDAARRGAQRYVQLGCRSCHIVEGSGGYVGPELSNTGHRLKPGWIMAWLSTPQTLNPGTLQPNYGLTVAEVSDLTSYLMTLRTGTAGGAP